MMGIAKNVVHFLGKTMKSWRVELICGAETLTEVPINRHFSRGYAITIAVLNALIPLTNILRRANPGYKF